MTKSKKCVKTIVPRDENFSTKNERVVLWALICSYHYSGKSSIAVVWSVGQNKSFSKNSKTKDCTWTEGIVPRDENFSTKNERVMLWALICSIKKAKDCQGTRAASLLLRSKRQKFYRRSDQSTSMGSNRPKCSRLPCVSPFPTSAIKHQQYCLESAFSYLIWA